MGKTANVLIVDDNKSLCRTSSLILELKGYSVAVAMDGAEALTKVSATRYDIIIIDVKMPGMDGVETFRQIKQIRPEAKVMMMTAYAVEGRIEEAIAEGAAGVLQKPLDMDVVIALIEEASAAGGETTA